MYFRSFLSLFLLTFFLSADVSAKVFLTYREFYALTPNQQKNYIDSMRQLTLKLESQPYLATDVKKTSGLYVYLLEAILNKAEASALSALCDVRSAAHYNTANLLSKIEQMMNCSEKLVPGGPNYFLPVVPGSAEVLSEEYKRRLESGQLNRKSWRVQEANGIFSSIVNGARKDGIYGGGDYSQQLKKVSENIVTTENLFTRASPKPVMKSLKQPNLETTAVEKKVVVPQTPQILQEPTLLCIYAGFVISKSDQTTCQPFSRLPKNFESGFFNPETFVCSGAAPVMCNPLLFGFESLCEKDEIAPCYNKKPLCITRSSSATKNCYERAKKKNTLPQVEDVWKSPNGENLYSEFTNSLEAICDSKQLEASSISSRAKKDIAQTCKVAFEVFQDNVERKFLPKTPKDSGAPGQR